MRYEEYVTEKVSREFEGFRVCAKPGFQYVLCGVTEYIEES